VRPAGPLAQKRAAIIPRPAVNLLLYHGVLAPRALWRFDIGAYRRELVGTTEVAPLQPAESGEETEKLPRVVIVDGGFGGLAAAKALKFTTAQSILIGRHRDRYRIIGSVRKDGNPHA